LEKKSEGSKPSCYSFNEGSGQPRVDPLQLRVSCKL
jgi:hypothetical protein